MNIKKIVFSNYLFFLLTTSIMLFLNLTPLIMQARHSPPNRTFSLIHNNSQDYYFYLSLMQEGANGAWLTYDPYTTESHQPSIIFSYFLWLGKLSKLFGISHAITYHLTRIILSIFLLLTSYFFILLLQLPYPRLAFLFFVFAAPFMHTINDYGAFRDVPFMSWWNGVDPIRRAAFLPHHMLGGFLLVLSIILLFKFIHTPSRPRLAKLILISAVMAFVHTPSLLILLLVLPVTVIVFIILKILSNKSTKFQAPKTKQIPNIKYQIPNILNLRFRILNLFGTLNFEFGISQFIGSLGYWLFGLLFLFVMLSQTKSGFPWSQYIDWERNLQFPLERELIGALGILFPFSLLGIYYAVKSKKFEYIFTACWLSVPLLLIPFARVLNLSNIRLIQGVPYLPLAILAVLGIKCSIDFAISSKMKNLFLIVISIIFLIFTLPTLKWSLTDQIREYWPIYGNVYLDNRLKNAFNFINFNFPPKSKTLATFYTGNYLPAYSQTVNYLGHFGYTYNVGEKEKIAQKFFEGKMSDLEAKSLLLDNKITLVFQGPEEKPLYQGYLYPSVLKPVYDKEEATLYVLR